MARTTSRRTYHEAGEKIGPLMSGAEWIHDGVAHLLQPRLDPARLDHRRPGARQNVDQPQRRRQARRLAPRPQAWENMLRDDGLQFNFISYADVIQNGVPKRVQGADPAGDASASPTPRPSKIKDFCQAGGTVDRRLHARPLGPARQGPRRGGALDDMFGVKHDPGMTAADVFQGTASSGARWTRTTTSTTRRLRTS